MKIIVIGAGAFGTAMAVSACRHPAGHAVELWARQESQAEVLRTERQNARYLPGIPLPHELVIRGGRLESLAAQSGWTDLVVVATPVAGLRETLAILRGTAVPVAWLCKGFEPSQDEGSLTVGLLPHEVQREVAPEMLAGALSGPSFAQEVARGQPTALVATSRYGEVRDSLVAAFHSQTVRVYANDDLIGVEVGGAVKNVLAIATGLADGMNLGLNARAALITRGLAEMSRLGQAMGGRAETFMGLSGLGDLVLTSTGDLSRNRRVGLLLAEGKSLPEAVASLGHVAEGVHSARTVLHRARHLGVEMPITEHVVDLLDGQLKPVEAVAALMGRDPKGELL